jgi:hypothetical protein
MAILAANLGFELIWQIKKGFMQVRWRTHRPPDRLVLSPKPFKKTNTRKKRDESFPSFDDSLSYFLGST